MAPPENNDTNYEVAAAIQDHSEETSLTTTVVTGANSKDNRNKRQKEITKSSDYEEEESFTHSRDTMKVLETYKRKRAVYGSGNVNGNEICEQTCRNNVGEKDTDTLNSRLHKNDNVHDDASSIATVACEINEDLFKMDDDDFINGLIKTDDSENSVLNEKVVENEEGEGESDNEVNNGNGNTNSNGEQEGDDEIVYDCTQMTLDAEEDDDKIRDGTNIEEKEFNVDAEMEKNSDNGYFPDDEEEEVQHVSRRGRRKKMAMLVKQSTARKEKPSDGPLIESTITKGKEDGKVTNTETKKDQDKEDSLTQIHYEKDEEEIEAPSVTPPKRTTTAATHCDVATKHRENLSSEQPSSRDLRKEIRRIFSNCESKSTTTIKEFRKLLEKSMGIKLDDDQKKFLKEQLTVLISAEDTSDDDEGGDGLDESDYEDNEKDSKAKNIRKRKKETHEDNFEDNESEGQTKRSPLTRSKTTPRRSRKPSHLKIHQEMRRKKLLSEAKVRAEELQAANEERLNEEDRKRAALIAKKFDTNTDEARIQRIEDRVGLLGRLKQKRLDLLAVQNYKSDDEEMALGMLSKGREKNDHNLTHDIYQNEKNEEFQENENEEVGEEESVSDDDDDFDDDDELEIVGSKPIIKANFNLPDGRTRATNRKKSPTSVLEMFGMKSNSSMGTSLRKDKKTIVASLSNPRAALRNALRAKQFETGNRWLAKELGYEKPEDHIRECKIIEVKKRKIILEKEEERLRHAQERNERLRALVKGESPEEENIGDNEDEENNHPRTVVNFSDEENEEEEEDEEMAMARQIESQRAEEDEEKDDDSKEKNTSSSLEKDEEHKSVVHDYTEKVLSQPEYLDDDEEIILDSTQEVDENSSIFKPDKDEESPGESEQLNEKQIDEENNNGIKKSDVDKTAKSDVEHLPEGDNIEKERRPKNAAWKAILEKEKQMLKRQKLFRKGKTVDDEAEEEEEEEGVAGLEDFGFTVESKKNEGEDDVDDADEEEFEDIVDEVSDGEGDEEAGDKARKALQAKEDKMRHKEVLRRIREGYDGRRGGVAGGGSKRGNLRFDQLVAADNKNDAKRLGLLNDDELDSEDEENNGTKEVEDEEVLIDRILKERYLNKPELPDEDFSDSDEENDQEENAEGPRNDYDEEDREQERLAKRFAKRARMNRLLEMHGHEQEFIQSRLLDEDEDLKKELTKIRTVHCKRLRQMSTSTSSNLGTSSTSNLSTKDSSSSSKDLLNQGNSLLPLGSTLSIALRQSRQSKKRKTSFLGGKDFGGRSRSSSSSTKRQVVSLGHVVFSGEPSNVSSMSKSSSNAPTSMTRSSSLNLAPRRGSSVNSRKRSTSESGKNGTSLWSKVSANSFRKRRKG